MNKKIISVTSVLAALVLLIGMAVPAMAATTTESVQTMLLNALQEERLAAATYQVVIDKFGEVEPFTNILKAEEQHIAAVENLLKVNNIDIPKNNVTAEAPETLEEAYAKTIEVEKEDIALYEKMLPDISDTMIKTVFTRLTNASEWHLKTFEAYSKGETPETGYMARNGRNGGSQMGINNAQGKGQGRMYRQRNNNQNNAQNGTCAQQGRNGKRGNAQGRHHGHGRHQGRNR
ncbi:ferritin-like domain-containing protein [Mesoaciditoga sp.]